MNAYLTRVGGQFYHPRRKLAVYDNKVARLHSSRDPAAHDYKAVVLEFTRLLRAHERFGPWLGEQRLWISPMGSSPGTAKPGTGGPRIGIGDLGLEM